MTNDHPRLYPTSSPAPNATEATPADGTILVEDLIAKCHTLLNELEEFRSFITDRRQEHAVDIRQFHTPVISELKSLQKISDADPTAEKTIHTLRSSNLPFYLAIWEAAKASKCLLTFHKRFYWDNRPTRESKKAAEKRCALVDVVARDGEEWIKVSTITESRLQFEVAKAHWEAADSSSSDDEDEDGFAINSNTNGHSYPSGEDDLFRIELVKVADDLLRASHAHRIHYIYPKIRFVLPKIPSNPPLDLLPIFDRIRSTGAIIDLGPQATSHEPLATSIFPSLLPSPHPPLTNILNIDCTILLALVSDLSHNANHPILPNYSAAITRQIELETREHLLPSSLWPAMEGKELVCTQEAAKRMTEIVETIGMPSERARTELLLANKVTDEKMLQGNELREAFAKHSDYPVPSDWRLPIRVVSAAVSDADIRLATQAGNLPSIAQQVAEQLTDINRSVLMYGWMQGVTTVSSNRTMTKWIEGFVEKEGQGAVGPDIWLREPARSLLGKEKGRRG